MQSFHNQICTNQTPSLRQTTQAIELLPANQMNDQQRDLKL